MTEYPYGYTAEMNPRVANGYRYSLTISNPKNANKPLSLFVLMMNPSVANSQHSDPTVNTLIRNLGDNYKQIIIVNTTPIIETNSDNLKAHQAEINDQASVNANVVANMVVAARQFHFLVATGEIKKGVNDRSYIELMDEIDRMTTGDGFYTVRLTKDGYGGHPLYKKTEEIQNLTHIRKADNQWHFRIG
ncbi:DUF1643 domain-containing protein [Lacticaseibacillus hulanensis]|uniref:DUF1643 domain-containing protein n=1 Tax=Lacticaseibacillus hulanensis TaxID=2493111 RepID=UPI000FDB0AC1|nr:DUF1643 domain-containing protein [Lacticaseibacillus hulanensis]